MRAGPLAEEGEERGHERHAHDQGVREDGDREQQPELRGDTSFGMSVLQAPWRTR